MQEYLDHKNDANQVRQSTDGQNEQFFVWSKCSWPFVNDSREEAFHGAKLKKEKLAKQFVHQQTLSSHLAVHAEHDNHEKEEHCPQRGER